MAMLNTAFINETVENQYFKSGEDLNGDSKHVCNESEAVKRSQFDGFVIDDYGDIVLNERQSKVVAITCGKIDRAISRTIKEIHKSNHIKTVYSCSGHRGQENGDQVYIMFEMDKKYVGDFLALAFDKITYEMDRTDLEMRLSRSCCYGWPSGNMERVTISLNDINHKYRQFQVNLARDYFWRLSTSVSELF